MPDEQISLWPQTVTEAVQDNLLPFLVEIYQNIPEKDYVHPVFYLEIFLHQVLSFKRYHLL